MFVVALRTDKPEAEIYLIDGKERLKEHRWQAHRKLAETVHTELTELLKLAGKDISNIEGVIAYEGPGSFTGLRIGVSVANAIHYGLDIPVVASGGEDWIETGLQKLAKQPTTIAMPVYGSAPHITEQKR